MTLVETLDNPDADVVFHTVINFYAQMDSAKTVDIILTTQHLFKGFKFDNYK